MAGIWAAEARNKQNRMKQTDSPATTLRVNFLLSNQQDKAVDLFLDMLKEDTGTVEAHLTLGNLFRSRGEVDRAIRIHQTLMESASLTYEQRLLAVQQLGRDYMAAGLYDRAEDMFTQLVDETDFRIGALQQLLQIYQATSDWQKAIDTAERLVKLGKDKQRVEIAHFYCELALQQMGSDDMDKAMALLKRRGSRSQQRSHLNHDGAGLYGKRGLRQSRGKPASRYRSG